MKKVNLLLSFLLLLFSISTLYSQKLNFFEEQGGAVSQDNLNAISLNPNKDIFLTGTFNWSTTIGTHSLNGFSHTPYWCKFDSSGNCKWAISPYLNADSCFGNAIYATNDGYFYTTGSFYGYMYFTYNNYRTCVPGVYGDNDDIYIAKYDTSGNFIWALTAGSGTPGMEAGIALAVDENKNVYLAGTFKGNASFASYVNSSYFNQQLISHGSQDIFLAQISPAGNFLKLTGFGGKKMDQVNGLSYNKGKIYMTGFVIDTCYSGNNIIPGNAAKVDGFVCQFDTSLNFKYMKRISSTNANFATGYGICNNAEGDILVTGISQGNTTYDGVNFITATADHSFLAKINAKDATLSWVQKIESIQSHNGQYGYDIYSNAVTSNNNNDVFITGYTAGNVALPNGDTLKPKGLSENGFIIKYDTYGNIRWSKQTTGNSYSKGTALAVAQEDLYFGGYFRDSMICDTVKLKTPNSSQHTFISKILDKDYPNTINNRFVNSSNGNNSTSTLISFPLTTNYVKVFPNPANDNIRLDYSGILSNDLKIKIFNSNGVLVYEALNASNSNSINVSSFPKGLYLIEVQTEWNVLTDKIIIQ